MRQSIRSIFFAGVATVLLCLGCGDNDSPTGTGGSGGDGGGTDTMTTLLETPANLCNGAPLEVLAACGQVNYSVAVTGPDWDLANAPSSVPAPSRLLERTFAADTTYTLNDGALTVTVTTSSDDTAQYFEIIYDGTGFGETFENFTYANGMRTNDRHRGEIYIYDQPLGTWQVLFSWSFGVLGQYFVAAHELNTGADVVVTFTLLMNEDYSGTYIGNYNSGEQHWEIDWNSAGNGTWTEYDTDGSTVIDSGSW